MTEENSLPTLALPALRARMGDWIYYVCFMKMRDIAARISVAKEIHISKSLRTLLQRELTNRSSEIATYLLSQNQRFFNALVVGTYGGNPEWNELAIKSALPGAESSSTYLNGTLGILTLLGTEKLFAIDGQHRVAGIRRALVDDPDIGDEEVSVIFVAGVTQEHRDEDPAGFERTRRLFTTLNRYAKPVSKKDIIALDEDDVIAIITRRLVEEYLLFQEKVSVKQTKSIPVTDKQSLTTIITLYDVLDIYLRSRARGWNKFKRFRPSDDEISEFYLKSKQLWDVLTRNFPPLKEFRDSDPGEKIAEKYRHSEGGHLLFRPIGLLLCIKVIRVLTNRGFSLAEAVNRLTRAPMEISNKPWMGLLWDATNLRMITSAENQKAALKLLFYALGGDLSVMQTNPEKLRNELSGILNMEVSDVELPKYT